MRCVFVTTNKCRSRKIEGTEMWWHDCLIEETLSLLPTHHQKFKTGYMPPWPRYKDTAYKYNKTPEGRIIFEKLVPIQLIKKLHVSPGSQLVPTKTSTQFYILFLKTFMLISILSSHLSLHTSSRLFPPSFPTKIFYTFLMSHCMTPLPHLISIMNFLSTQFFHPPVTYFHFGPNILIPHTPSICLRSVERKTKFHTHINK
jgi:hypothetical protein